MKDIKSVLKEAREAIKNKDYESSLKLSKSYCWSSEKKIVEYCEKLLKISDYGNVTEIAIKIMKCSKNEDISNASVIYEILVNFLAKLENLPSDLWSLYEECLSHLIQGETVNNSYYSSYLSILYKLKRYEDLLEHAEKMHNLFESDTISLVWICKVYNQLFVEESPVVEKYFKKVMEYSAKLLEVEPKNAIALFSKSITLLRENRTVDAKDILVEVQKNMFMSWGQRVIIRVRKSHMNACETAFNYLALPQGIGVLPRRRGSGTWAGSVSGVGIAGEALADAYFIRGSYTSALKCYEKSFRIGGGHSLSKVASNCQYKSLTQTESILGQNLEAKEDFEEILRENGQYVPALKGLAETCMCQARECYRDQRLGTARDYVQVALDKLSIAVLQKGEFSCLWKLLADSCLFVARLPEKYCCLLIQDGVLDGKQLGERNIVEREELFVITRTVKNYVKCPKQLGPPNYALATTHQAVSADHNCAVSWCNLGILYLLMNDIKLANRAFSQGQRSDPNYVNSWIGQ
ncbi:hypothetical protein NQ318_008467, partial [Aromia moschata]